jgi:hypothetical protein
MFFYLLKNSSLLNKPTVEDKNIQIIIYGTIAYVILHAVMFAGGTDSLLYHFKYYYWVILGLDLAVIILKDMTNLTTSFNSLLNRNNEEANDQYRMIIPNSDVNLDPINPQQQQQQQPRKKVKKEKKVQFENEYRQEIPRRHEPTLENLNSNKSTPLSRLNKNYNIEPDGFSDSESEYNSDLDLESFEKGLSF